VKPTRLQAGESAPLFRVEDWQGETIDLQRRGKKRILLSFFRYASCPLCNLRIGQLINRHEQLTKSGVEVIAVFQSPPQRIRRYVGQQRPPFTIIPDPHRRLYRLYRVESSWKGFFRAWTIGIGKVFSAVIGNGFLPGTVEGELHRIPADFVIDSDGQLIEAYYGKDIGDHLPMDRILGLGLAK